MAEVAGYAVRGGGSQEEKERGSVMALAQLSSGSDSEIITSYAGAAAPRTTRKTLA